MRGPDISQAKMREGINGLVKFDIKKVPNPCSSISSLSTGEDSKVSMLFDLSGRRIVPTRFFAESKSVHLGCCRLVVADQFGPNPLKPMLKGPRRCLCPRHRVTHPDDIATRKSLLERPDVRSPKASSRHLHVPCTLQTVHVIHDMHNSTI